MSGLPDFSSLDTYGGALQDYAAVEDPTTDESAAYRNQYAADTAMMTVTAPRALLTFVGDATTPGDPASGFVHAALWGSEPGVKPAVVRTSAGIYDVTWPASVNDPLAVSHTVNFRRAFAQVEPGVAAVLCHAVAERTGANTVRIYTYLANGTADDLVGLNINVEVY